MVADGKLVGNAQTPMPGLLVEGSPPEQKPSVLKGPRRLAAAWLLNERSSTGEAENDPAPELSVFNFLASLDSLIILAIHRGTTGIEPGFRVA